MKEPSAEDMACLSDHNIKWCVVWYFTELAKRSEEKAESLLIHLTDILDDFTLTRTGFKAIPHRQVT